MQYGMCPGCQLRINPTEAKRIPPPFSGNLLQWSKSLSHYSLSVAIQLMPCSTCRLHSITQCVLCPDRWNPPLNQTNQTRPPMNPILKLQEALKVGVAVWTVFNRDVSKANPICGLPPVWSLLSLLASRLFRHSFDHLSDLRVFVLHPGMTPLGNDPEWLKITRFYPETCLNGVNT